MHRLMDTAALTLDTTALRTEALGATVEVRIPQRGIFNALGPCAVLESRPAAQRADDRREEPIPAHLSARHLERVVVRLVPDTMISGVCLGTAGVPPAL